MVQNLPPFSGRGTVVYFYCLTLLPRLLPEEGSSFPDTVGSACRRFLWSGLIRNQRFISAVAANPPLQPGDGSRCKDTEREKNGQEGPHAGDRHVEKGGGWRKASGEITGAEIKEYNRNQIGTLQQEWKSGIFCWFGECWFPNPTAALLGALGLSPLL